MIRIFIWARLFFFLAGCMTAPQRDVKEIGAPLPDQWGEGEAFNQPIPTQWVATFGDAQLNTLVDIALANNYELKAAAARVGAAVAQARIDGSSRWPQFFFTADHQQVQIREAGFGASRFGVFEALFGLSWEVDVWGRIRDFQQASVLEADAMNTDYYGARLSLAARVAQSYFELTEAKLLVAVVEQSIKDRTIIANLVRGRFQRGLVRGLDLRLALTDLANAEGELKEARNLIQNIARRLEILLGHYPAGKEVTSTTLPQLPAVIPAGLPAELLERRRIWLPHSDACKPMTCEPLAQKNCACRALL